MIKENLTEEISRVLGIPLKEARQILEMMLGSIVRALKRGERVQVRGFGTFTRRLRGSRVGCNPQTRVPHDVLAKAVPHFKASGILNAMLNPPNFSAGATQADGVDRSTQRSGGMHT